MVSHVLKIDPTYPKHVREEEEELETRGRKESNPWQRGNAPWRLVDHPLPLVAEMVQGRIHTTLRICKQPDLLNFRVDFPHQFQLQGANTFLEMQGKIYPSLVREFYRKLITLNEELFLNIGGLSSFGSPLGDCENEQWKSFDAVEIYKSCMCGPHYFVSGELTNVGSLTMENFLLHYLIAYILVQRNTSHAQHTINDLKLLFTIEKVMFGITSSPSRLLAYGIFISRVINHLEIDTSEVKFTLANTGENLFGEHFIQKM
ncbi:hypothetical protein Lal_00033614 [Lupinus albus]|nr:hypothetical protein Lal_00033614 [Lupinus albus]